MLDIKLLLADDHPILLKGLVSFLSAFLGEAPPAKAQISNQDVLHFTFSEKVC